MLRNFSLALVIVLAAPRLASAETDPALARWEQPDGVVVQENDPAAPFVSFFTPIYRDDDRIATWSMMATKWRSNGQVDLSVGVRLVHDDALPWGVIAAKLEDGSPLALDTLEPIRTCGADGACVQRETAAITLSRASLKHGMLHGLQIRLISANGPDRAIAFPQDILEQLYRESGAGQAP